MIIQLTKNILFPKQCYGCNRANTYLCDECFHKYVRFNTVQKCHICGLKVTNDLVHEDCREETFLDGVLCVASYGDFLKRIIRDGKYSHVADVFEDLGMIMGQYLELFNAFRRRGHVTSPSNHELKINYVTSVPMHSGRKRARGYNQAEILARSFSGYSDLAFSDLISRNRNTRTQVGMGKHQREINLTQAFSLTDPSLSLQDKNVMMVDDVFTTGTTMNLCAKILKDAGAKSVYGFAFARSRERVKIW